MDGNRTAALAFTIAVPVMQLFRSICFHEWPQTLAEMPFAFDAYVAGVLGLAAVWLAARSRLLLSAAWGFWAGILYRSFFQQLGDPTRHAGAQGMVLAWKGVLLACAVAGLVGSVRPARVP